MTTTSTNSLNVKSAAFLPRFAGRAGVFLGLALWTTVALAPASRADTAGQEALAQEAATLFRAARKVISDNQSLINDPEKGDKGLSGEFVVAKAKENFQAATGQPVNEAEATLKVMLEAAAAVMTDAQPLINEKGKAFKGFLPAVFARQVAERTVQKSGGKIFIKLTAPQKFLRNRANRADEWETMVMDTKFNGAAWEKGKAFTESGEHKGRKGFRLALPEYYGESCLSCHGDPKGERDISGGLKEGGKLNDLGGTISVVVYDN